MGKKRSRDSDSESDDSDFDVLHGNDDEDNNENNSHSDDDDDDDDENMEGFESESEIEVEDNENEKLLSPSTPNTKKKGMLMRSGRRKRRRSVGTTGLTPPETSRRAKKRIRTDNDNDNNNDDDDDESSVIFGDKRLCSVSFAESKRDTEKDNGSPGIAGPRRISYGLSSNAKPSDDAQQSQSSSSEEEEEPNNEIDVVPPKPITQTNGSSSTRSISEDVILQNPPPENTNVPRDDDDKIDEIVIPAERVDEPPPMEDTNAIPPTGSIPTWQRLGIFVILGYLSLLLGLPRVIKLTRDVVPLDDSVLPPNPKLVIPNASLSEEEEEVGMEVDPSMVALESWNKEFSNSLEKLDRSAKGYSSSKDSFEEYYNELLGRLGNIAAQLGPKEQELEDRFKNLNMLEDLLKQQVDSPEYDGEAGRLARELLGETILSTSSIDLWDMKKSTDVKCDFGPKDEERDEERDDNDEDDEDSDGGLAENEEEDTEPLLLASVLEEKLSNLVLRSTITAEKFVGGAVAEDRIRAWVQNRIQEMLENDEDASEVIQEIEEFAQQLTTTTETTTVVAGTTTKNTNAQLLFLSEIIQNRLGVHRADTTGVYDYASLKNGAQVIYGGKRGTSKSLVDGLPILNRILQNSKLRFYGFGPEAALTATYPPGSLGQCWSFRQTSLKEQLRERQTIFENDKKVKNDFKRGNFGTLTVRLSEPVSVRSIVVEHPPPILQQRSTTSGQRQPPDNSSNSNSAIRKFRVVGYEDEMATSKAWNLGSFEYNLQQQENHHKSLQTFEAATTVFGKEIPPLHSISLAVDSNHGHDYSCLYRFRVHGTTN